MDLIWYRLFHLERLLFTMQCGLIPEAHGLELFKNMYIVSKTRWPVPFFNGRGIFQYTFGILPQRHPITVVGKDYTYNLFQYELIVSMYA